MSIRQAGWEGMVKTAENSCSTEAGRHLLSCSSQFPPHQGGCPQFLQRTHHSNSRHRYVPWILSLSSFHTPFPYMVQSHLKAWDGEEGTDPVSRQMAGIRVLGIRNATAGCFSLSFSHYYVWTWRQVSITFASGGQQRCRYF